MSKHTILASFLAPPENPSFTKLKKSKFYYRKCSLESFFDDLSKLELGSSFGGPEPLRCSMAQKGRGPEPLGCSRTHPRSKKLQLSRKSRKLEGDSVKNTIFGHLGAADAEN